MARELTAQGLIVTNRFYAQAPRLRACFEDCYSDPLNPPQQRFSWDYWHVPEQYTLVRTLAEHFFPKKIFTDFQKKLIAWGRQNLGCAQISQPWLSYYVEGCYQDLHADVPHGPWAFVFSLTRWNQRKFSGGETVILKAKTLNYWQNFDSTQGLERKHLVQEIAPQFNRLVVFDPRFPHGVKEVRGVRDPLQARLVIHGWFTEPRPFAEGALPARKAIASINENLPPLAEALAQRGLYQGLVCVRLHITPAGKVAQLRLLSNSLVATDPQSQTVAKTIALIKGNLSSWRFASARGKSQITLPLIFQ